MSGAVLDPGSARVALVAACVRVGLDPGGAELIRIGENAVFRLRAPIVGRVSRSEGDRAVRMARWLRGHGIPTVTPYGIAQPIVVAGWVVTLWDAVTTGYGTPAELGGLLRRLHAVDPPAGLEPVAPREQIERWLAKATIPTGELRARAERLCPQYERREFVPVVVHGDANVGNVLRTADGRPVLADLDSVAVGPREWDLVPTALFADRLGWHSEAEYRAFAAAYGQDVREDPGYPVLRELRALLMLAWLTGRAGVDERAGAEFARRMRTTEGWRPL